MTAHVTTGVRSLAGGQNRTCPKCRGRRLTVQFETITITDDVQPSWRRRDSRDRFQCLDCWHVWYEHVWYEEVK